MLRTLVILAFITLTMASNAAAGSRCEGYQYRARVTKIIDAVNIKADIDLGFNTWRKGELIAIEGADVAKHAREKEEAGEKKDSLASQLLHKWVVVCVRQQKIRTGRPIRANIYVGDRLINPPVKKLTE